MSLECFIVMSTLEMLIKPLCDDDAEQMFKRVYYECSQILQFSLWIDGLTGVENAKLGWHALGNEMHIQ